MHVSGARYLFHRLRKYQSSNLKSVFPLDHVLNLYTQHLHQSCEKSGEKTHIQTKKYASRERYKTRPTISPNFPPTVLIVSLITSRNYMESQLSLYKQSFLLTLVCISRFYQCSVYRCFSLSKRHRLSMIYPFMDTRYLWST